MKRRKSNKYGIVYILQDEKGKYYIGSTDNLPRRISQHELGQTPTTHRMKNPVLVFSQEFLTLQIARKVELKLKKLKRKDYINKIISDGFIKLKI